MMMRCRLRQLYKALPAALMLAAALSTAAHAQAPDLLARARTLADAGQLDSAVKLAEAAVRAEPNRAEAHHMVGEYAGRRAGQIGGLGALGAARKSKAGFSRAVALEPANTRYLTSLAGFLSQAPGIAGGNRDSALALAVVVRRSDEVQGTFLMADVLRRGNNREKARGDSLIDAFARARASDRIIQLRAAGYYAASDRPARSMAIHDRLLAADSTDAVARYGVARSLVLLGRDPGVAVRHLQYALGRPTPPEGQPRFSVAGAWWRMGQAFAQMDQADSARAAYERALAADPQFRPARLSLDSLSRR